MSDQHPSPYGDGSQQPYQPPPAGDSYPPPTSGPGYPPPPPPGGGYPPPPPTSGGGFPPPPPTSGGGFPPPTSGGGYPPPQGGGYDQGFGGQPGYGGQPAYGAQPGGYDPNAGQFGQPGGGYDPNAGQQPFGAAPGPVTPPARRGGPLKIILVIVGVVLLLCCIGGVVFAVKGSDLLGGNAGNADTGDCLSGKSIDERADQFQEADLEIVECTESDAKYKVVGRVDNKTQAQATDEVCQPFAEAELIYWQGRTGEEGTVLCLKKNQ